MVWPRAFTAVVLGLAAPMAAIRGTAVVMVHPDHQRAAYLAVGGTTALAVLVATAVRRWAGSQLVVQAAASVATPLFAAASAGRVAGFVAVSCAFATYAAVVEWRPVSGRPQRAPAVALVALAAAVAAQLTWYLTNSSYGTLACCVATFLLCEAYHRAPEKVVPADRAIRHGAAWIAGLVPRGLASAGRVLASGAGRFAASVHRVLAIDPGLSRSALVGAVVALVFAPMFWGLVNTPGALVVGINDFGPHVDEARAFTLVPFRLEIPQALFHVLTAGWSSLVGDPAAPVVVLTVSMWATYVATFVLVRQGWRLRGEKEPGWWWPAGAAALFVLMETPTLLFMWLGWIEPTTRFFTIHVLYSPTWLVALPFALFTVATLGWVLDGPSELGPGLRIDRRWIFAAAVGVGAFAKPSLALCLIPGLATYVVLVERMEWGRAAKIVAWVAVPGGAVIAWQMWFLSTSTSEFGSDGFTFAPISGPIYGWSEARWAFWIPMLWLPLAAWIGRRDFLADRQTRVMACSFVYAVAIYLLFRETGPRAGHGNLGVPAQLSMTILILLAFRVVVVRAAAAVGARRDGARTPGWLPVVAVVACAFLAGGVLAVLDSTGTVDVPISWDPYF